MRPPRAEGQVASRWRGGSLRPLGPAARLLTRLCRRLAGKRPQGAGGPHRARVSSRPPPAAHRDPGGPSRRWLPNGSGRPCRAGGTHAQAARRAERGVTIRGSELTGWDRASGDPRQQLRWPRPLFLLQQRRLVKGKDVRGSGSGCRRVSRDWAELSRSLEPSPRPPGPAREARATGESARARLLEDGKGTGFNGWGGGLASGNTLARLASFQALRQSALLGFRL